MRLQTRQTQYRCRSWSLATIIVTLFSTSSAYAAETCPGPVSQVALSRDRAVGKIAKDKANTQGLLYFDGQLLESVGVKGKSELRRIDPRTGMKTTVQDLGDGYFAEGLAILGSELFQLTLAENQVFVYNSKDLKPKEVRPQVTPHGNAWGLTTLNDQLVMSDGSSHLYFMDEKLSIQRTLSVRSNGKPYGKLNELESAHGKILANTEDSDQVAVIDPKTGCVESLIDLSPLRIQKDNPGSPSGLNDPFEAVCETTPCTASDFVANGIAFDPAKDELYFTGKNWMLIFVFKYPQ